MNANLALQQIVAQKQQQDAMKSHSATHRIRKLLQLERRHEPAAAAANTYLTQALNCRKRTELEQHGSSRNRKNGGENMGTGLFDLSLRLPVARSHGGPSVTAMGMHIVLRGYIMLVWSAYKRRLHRRTESRVQHGEVSQLSCCSPSLRNGTIITTAPIPGLLFHQGFIDGGTIKSCEP